MALVVTGRLAQRWAMREEERFLSRVRSGCSEADLARDFRRYAGSIKGVISSELNARFGSEITKLAAAEDYLETFVDPAEDPGLKRTVLLQACENQWKSSDIPPAISRRLHLASCPPLELWSFESKDLFVTPNGFEVLSREKSISFGFASTRRFHQAPRYYERFDVKCPVVLIQDCFHGANFAHFLFDWICRIALFRERFPEESERALFILGGFPGEFHRAVLRSVVKQTGLHQDQLFFPTVPITFGCLAHCYIFSDVLSASGHPGQMFQPKTQALLQPIFNAVQGDSQKAERFMISRGDSNRRVLLNEEAALESLRPFGFRLVRLAELPIHHQIGLFRSAEAIVAPHGMGLTHVAFSSCRPLVVEIHNPSIGTDAYCFAARSSGCRYVPVVGIPTGKTGDFTVDVAILHSVIAANLSTRDVRVYRETRELRIGAPNTRWNDGQQRRAPTPLDQRNPSGRTTALRHFRDGANLVRDTNVGYWEVLNLRAGEIYEVACELFLPADVEIKRVEMQISWGVSALADTAIRDAWQRISVTRTCPHDRTDLTIVVRVHSDNEAVILSDSFTVSCVAIE